MIKTAIKDIDGNHLFQPAINSKCRVTICGKHIEVMYAEHRSKGSPTIKIDKTQYLDIRTGEVFETQIQEKRTDDTISLAQSLKNGRDIINTNCEDTEKLKWITLTYKENMQDPKRLKKDIEMFIKNTRYNYGNFEYIICREPQGRGAWHAHIILIFENKAPYMKNKDVANIWKNGFVTVKKMVTCDNLGAYLSAYLADMPIEDNANGMIYDKLVKSDGNLQEKRIVKGARLKMYPSGFHIFTYSKGIKKPLVEYTSEPERILQKYKSDEYEQTYVKTTKLSSEDGKYTNTLSYIYFRKKEDKQ